jgi:predicted homoserine dehydrogenase-like protein
MKSSYIIGIVGTGFIARGLIFALEGQANIRPGPVLTRRRIQDCKDFPRPELLTPCMETLLRNTDLIVECSGHPLHAADVIDHALERGIPVVTLNVEFHVTLGSCFEGRGYLTEAEGDQPGVIARLRSELIEMGFSPTGYGNLKRFCDLNPSPDDMAYWAQRQGISLQQVTAFTDGTKLQLEMALVANAFGAGLLRPGMCGMQAPDVGSFGEQLGAAAEAAGHSVVDYAVSPAFPAGVLITAQVNDPRQASYLEYLKLGKGPSYTFVRPYHLCHLEVMKTIRRALTGAPLLLTNGPDPRISVAAVAKKRLEPGEHIDHGIGSFKTRGICVNTKDEPEHVPIGLLYDAEILASVEAGDLLRIDQVRLPDSLGLSLWKSRHRTTVGGHVAADRFIAQSDVGNT